MLPNYLIFYLNLHWKEHVRTSGRGQSNYFIIAIRLHKRLLQPVFFPESDSPVREFLGEAKVGDLQVTLAVQEKILGLEIPVNYMLVVQILQGADYLSRVKTAGGSGEPAGRSQVGKELATGDEFQQHVDPSLVSAAPEPEKTTTVLKSRQSRYGYAGQSRWFSRSLGEALVFANTNRFLSSINNVNRETVEPHSRASLSSIPATLSIRRSARARIFSLTDKRVTFFTPLDDYNVRRSRNRWYRRRSNYEDLAR